MKLGWVILKYFNLFWVSLKDLQPWYLNSYRIKLISTKNIKKLEQKS